MSARNLMPRSELSYNRSRLIIHNTNLTDAAHRFPIDKR